MLQATSISEIDSGLFIGNSRSSYDPPTLRDNHISAVVSLVNRPLLQWSRPSVGALVPKERHLLIECADSSTQDLLQYMDGICSFIDRMLLVPPGPSTAATPGGTLNHVLVHCDKGSSRSPTVIIAYLMRKHKMALPDVLAMVERKRRVQPNPGFMDQLKVWEDTGYQIWEDSQPEVFKPPYLGYLRRRAEVLKSNR